MTEELKRCKEIEAIVKMKTKEIEPILRKSIKDLGFSIKACRALEGRGYNTVLDLISRPEYEKALYAIPGLGKALVTEIVDKIHSLGLSFSYESMKKMEDENRRVRQQNEPITTEDKPKWDEIDYLLRTHMESLSDSYNELNERQFEYQRLSEEILSRLQIVASQSVYSKNKIEFMRNLVKEKCPDEKEAEIIFKSIEAELDIMFKNEAERIALEKKQKEIKRGLKKTEREIIENQIDRMILDGSIELE